MKITKRQLRRIIKEEKAKLKEYGGRPYDPTVPSERSKQISAGMNAAVEDYVAWTEENGHITPAASSVVASYIVEDPKREGSKVVIADAFGLMVSDISHEVKVQQAEKAAMMGESKMRVSKRQLRRIIKEEKTKLIKERSMASGEGELIADLTSIQGALEDISNGMYGLVDPDGYASSGDEMAQELMLQAERLNTFLAQLKTYFKTVDDLAGRNPGGSIG